MSLPFKPVSHLPAADGSGDPDYGARCYSIRVMRFAAGATIAFNDVNNRVTVVANCNYPFPPEGWERIFLTGTISIEVSTRKDFVLEPVAPPADQNGNTPIVGATAEGAAPAASAPPVEVAGLDGGGLVRALPVNINGAAARVASIGVTYPTLLVGGAGADTFAHTFATDVLGRLKTVPRAADWAITNTSAAAGTATATKAASAGVRHVCKTLAASIGAGAAAQGPLNVVIRDGATGVGAIIHAGELAAPANSGDSYVPAQLDQVGTAGNAMTVEFTAAGAANTVQTVNAAGYDLSASD